MRNRRNEGQEFLEKLNRLLAGEDVGAGEDADEDLRTAVEFSRRLSGLYPGPSPEFSQRLRSRLLSRLSQEKQAAAGERAGKGWLRRLLARVLPESPVWRTAIGTAVVAVLVVAVAWQTGMFTAAPTVEETLSKSAPGEVGVAAVMEEGQVEKRGEIRQFEATEEAPVPLVAPQALPLGVQASPAGPIVSGYGQEVSFDLVFTNTTQETITVAPFPPAAIIVSSAGLAHVRTVSEAGGEATLPASATVTQSIVWDQTDDSGDQVAPGWYTVLVGSVNLTTGDESLAIEVPAGPQVLVEYPQGALEASVEVHQPEMVGEFTVILERLELSNLGCAVYTTISPGYGAPEEGGPRLPASGTVQVSAWYSVDGGPPREAGSPCELFSEDENVTRLSWECLDPVPSDAQLFTFTLTRIGESEGPWEFRIPLR